MFITKIKFSKSLNLLLYLFLNPFLIYLLSVVKVCFNRWDKNHERQLFSYIFIVMTFKILSWNIYLYMNKKCKTKIWCANSFLCCILVMNLLTSLVITIFLTMWKTGNVPDHTSIQTQQTNMIFLQSASNVPAINEEIGNVLFKSFIILNVVHNRRTITSHIFI